MNDLLIVFIGLSIIFYIFFVLGTSRTAINKGYPGLPWFLFSIILPAVAYIIILLLKPKTAKASEDYHFTEKIIMDLSQPFVDLAHTSRALLGVNLSYVLEGLTYFGVVGLLAIFFNEYINLNDIDAGQMVGIQTAGITIAMLFLGATVDWIGLRKSLLIALSLMLIGRVLLTVSPDLGVPGLWGSAHLFAMLGILGIILGYGIYQPACYAGVKILTNEKTAAMGYAMLYALMNLGGFLPGLISPPVRRAYGITGVFWVYVALTVAGIAIVYLIITKKAMEKAVKEVNSDKPGTEEKDEMAEKSTKEKIAYYIKNFPLKDLRFLYFVFILIFVQTLFAHNWLTIPQYTSRAFGGQTYFGIPNFIEDNFEFFVNLNPILIFILTPMVTALTSKKDTYNMMIIGTFVMASPTFILALGPNLVTILSYITLMTIGEAMWQPRFLQWVAEIAPKNMTGIYMGIGQFPWFLTKVITSLYSGWFLMNYCPADTPPSEMNTETMWLIYGFIAIISPVGLLLAKGWMKKGFKVKHE
jgi:MFS family permease